MNLKQEKKETINYWTCMSTIKNQIGLGEANVFNITITVIAKLDTKNRSAIIIFDHSAGHYILVEKSVYMPLRIKTMNKIFRRANLFGQCRPWYAAKSQNKKMRVF